MPLHSRRAVLTSVAAATAGLAGCATGSDDDPTATPTANEPQQFTGESTDPPTATLRRPDGGSLVRSSERTPDPGRGDYLTTVWAITTDDDADAFTFPEGTENVAAARSLLDGTDFASEAVVCQQYISEDCLTRQVERVRWAEEAVAIDYRAVEVDRECDVDEGGSEATLIRVPTALDDGLGYFAASVEQS